MRLQSVTPALALFAAALATTSAFAVTDGVGVGNKFPYVGQTRQSVSPTTADVLGGRGSGSYLSTPNQNGTAFVLTASHVTNYYQVLNLQGGATAVYLTPTFERFQFGGTGDYYFGLGVQAPQYNPTVPSPEGFTFNIGQYDVALLLVLNAPAMPNGFVAPTLVAPGNGLARGDSATIVGFARTDNNNKPLMGTMTLNPAGNNGTYGDISPQNYFFYKPPSANLSEGGDSGGPEVIPNTDKIVSVTSFGGKIISGNTTTSYTGTARIDSEPNYSFASGNGDSTNQMATINSLDHSAGGTTANWTATTWSRGKAGGNTNTVPMASDVVVLDPNPTQDSATNITLDANSQPLAGLANDVTLNVLGTAAAPTTLNVSALSKAGFFTAGILNTGTINVSGPAFDKLGLITSSAKLDNPGTLNIGRAGRVTVGNAIPPIPNQPALNAVYVGATTGKAAAGAPLPSINVSAGGEFLALNPTDQNAQTWIDTDGKVSVTGVGSVFRTNYLYNAGDIAVTGGAFTVANTNQISGSYLNNVGTITLNPGGLFTSAANRTNTQPDVANGGTITLNPGSAFQIQSPVDPNSDQLGSIRNNGTVNSQGNFLCNSIANNRAFNTGGGSLITNSLVNTDLFTVGIVAGGGFANVGYINNNNPGATVATVSVAFGATLNVTPSPAFPQHSIDNVKGLVNVANGATLNVTYNNNPNGDGYAFVNPAGSTINVAAATLRVINGDLYNDGLFRLAANGDALFSNADFVNAKSIDGPQNGGTLRFSGESSFSNQFLGVTPPQYDTRLIRYIFDNDTGTMEAPTDDTGGGEANLVRLLDPTAIYDLSIINNSTVDLVDLFANSAGPVEAIYCEYLGVDATSTLNLGNINVYYHYLDPAEGNLDGTIISTGGHIIQLPDPALTPLLLLLSPLTSRRRRRRN